MDFKYWSMMRASLRQGVEIDEDGLYSKIIKGVIELHCSEL